jgi:hypothetical protein
MKAVNRLNDLSAKEWIPETVSVWIQRGLGQGHEHAQIERQGIRLVAGGGFEPPTFGL